MEILAIYLFALILYSFYNVIASVIYNFSSFLLSVALVFVFLSVGSLVYKYWIKLFVAYRLWKADSYDYLSEAECLAKVICDSEEYDSVRIHAAEILEISPETAEIVYSLHCCSFSEEIDAIIAEKINSVKDKETLSAIEKARIEEKRKIEECRKRSASVYQPTIVESTSNGDDEINTNNDYSSGASSKSHFHNSVGSF